MQCILIVFALLPLVPQQIRSLEKEAPLESVKMDSRVLADFWVLRRQSSQPNDWMVVGTAQNPLELGERARFEACGTTGAYWVFDYGDQTWNTNFEQCWDEKGFAFPGMYPVTLTIYDEIGTPVTVLSKTVHVISGMQTLSMQGFPAEGGNFQPISQTAIGTELWALSNGYRLGVASIANPAAIENFRIQPTPGATEPLGLANAFGRLYVADAAQGVLIYSPIRNQVQILGQIPRSQLDNQSASQVLAFGNVLYVVCGSAGQIFVFDLANPLSPSLIAALSLGTGIMDVGIQGPDALFVRRSDAKISAIDMRQPRNPRFVLDSNSAIATVSLNYPSHAKVCADNRVSVASDVTRSLLLDIGIENGVMSLEWSGILSTGAVYAAMTDTRLWSVAIQGRVSKYDISNRSNPYLMHTQNIAGDSLGMPFLHDPDGSGPLPVTLYVSSNTGFVAVRP